MVRMACEGVQKIRTNHQAETSTHPPASDAHLSNVPSHLILATGSLQCIGLPDWTTSWEDPEQVMSLHRWNWLLFRLYETGEAPDSAWGLRLMRSWLRRMGAVPAGIAGTTYTTGERIANAVLFLARVGKNRVDPNAIPEDITRALRSMAVHIAGHLEYKEPELSGNHVIQNARALLFAGAFLCTPAFSELARVILRERLPSLITEDGFLREGSSHYHFLFTRWVLEMDWVAQEVGDRITVSILQPIKQKLLERCWFFLVYNDAERLWQIPTIGDVSPDCTPAWLLMYLWPDLEAARPPSARDRLEQFERSGWVRCDRDETTMFWHFRLSAPGLYPTHGHNDTGSFVLCIRGAPVLVDPGRPSYMMSDPFYSYSGSASAHNSLVVDGIEPLVPEQRRWLPFWYRDAKVEVLEENVGGDISLILRHTGYNRVAVAGFVHERRWVIGLRRLYIEDMFSGDGAHIVETFFQWSPQYALHPQSAPSLSAHAVDTHGMHITFAVERTSAGTLITHVRGQRQPKLAGWTFPAYGTYVPSVSTMISTRTTFPASFHYQFKW